ncbi:unnamed protein product [Gordionus sp. m RMFG-2023]
MSWFNDNFNMTWSQNLIMRILKLGPIPRHIAFIMDGNRRYAKKIGITRNFGHLKGFETLSMILHCGLKLGFKEVTVYAFSIENLKRSKDEIDELMELAKEKFEKLLQEKSMLDKYRIRIRVWGNLSFADEKLLQLINYITCITKHNENATLNICFFYTSTDETVSAINALSNIAAKNIFDINNIKDDIIIKDHLFTKNSLDIDLLVRTSGETRISDFLTWQIGYSCLYFVDILWPEFTIWQLFKAVLFYQFNYIAIQVYY